MLAPLPIDRELFRWVVVVSNQPGLEWLAFLFWILTVSVTAVVLAALYYYWRVRRDHKFTALIVISSIATFAATEAIKWLAQRPRPHITDLLSFPSRHTALAFMLAFLIGAYVLSNKEKGSYKWPVAVSLFTWAALVGLSRLWLEEHWLTDVFAGAVIGALLGWIFWKMRNRIYKK
ncbi:MAG: phosphatase PAP2 family protein [DPANN group archaeon]|nr:phosphatase PAP2 family protein [DPANN group archaeon]